MNPLTEAALALAGVACVMLGAFYAAYYVRHHAEPVKTTKR